MRGWFIRMGLPLAPLSDPLDALDAIRIRRWGVWERVARLGGVGRLCGVCERVALVARLCKRRLSRQRGRFRPTVARVVVAVDVAVPTLVGRVRVVTVRVGATVAAAAVVVAVLTPVGTCTAPQLPMAASNPGST